MWSGELPENVAQAIRGFHPVKAAMGVNDAYVLVSGDGRFKWNLRGKYATLDRILRNSTLAIDVGVLFTCACILILTNIVLDGCFKPLRRGSVHYNVQERNIPRLHAGSPFQHHLYGVEPGS